MAGGGEELFLFFPLDELGPQEKSYYLTSYDNVLEKLCVIWLVWNSLPNFEVWC